MIVCCIILTVESAASRLSAWSPDPPSLCGQVRNSSPMQFVYFSDFRSVDCAFRCIVWMSVFVSENLSLHVCAIYTREEVGLKISLSLSHMCVSVIRPPRHDAEPQSSVPLTCFFAKGGVRDRQPWANAVAAPRQALLAQGI